MHRLRLTSPGVLLILAVALAGGIVLLDVFFLSPYLDDRKDAALQEQATRAEQGVRQAVQSELNNLLFSCSAAAKSPEMAGGTVDANAFAAVCATAFARGEVRWAWMTGPEGEITAFWARPAEPSAGPLGDSDLKAASQPSALSAERLDANELAAALRRNGGRISDNPTGIVCMANSAVFCAVLDLDAAGSAPGHSALWVARSIDADALKWVGCTLGGELSFTQETLHPFGTLLDGTSGHEAWAFGENGLAVAWAVNDFWSQPGGYFRLDIPVAQINGQANAARRIVLTILSLSMALVLLVILGTHTLVSGPIIRLLRRLQDMDSSEAGAKDLTRDLHGEPLILARKLESAFEKLAHISKTDQLTSLANRRHFAEVLECFYHQSRRYNRPLSVIMVDVDYFKAVNDSAGHQTGDAILKIVSSFIEKACRKADLPARLGGDEFAILLPETLACDAQRVAERLRGLVAEKNVAVNKFEFTVTVSIGVADLNSGEIDGPDGMLALADKALYAAKEAGRNRVVLAHELTAGGEVGGGQEKGKVDLLCRKLAGLDNQFKDLFLQAVEEVVDVMEQRDPHMADHARKVQHYALLIAREMDLPPSVHKRLQVAAMLHDIGMLAMPDAVLLSPEQLSAEQLQRMRQHPLLSVRVMERMEFLEQEIPAVRYHHERFDGKGYPEGIAGPAIPLTARILAVADCFDAMTSERTHRKALTPQEGLEELRRSGGTQFDPAVVDAFGIVAARMGEKLVEIPAPVPGQSRWREPLPALAAAAAEMPSSI